MLGGNAQGVFAPVRWCGDAEMQGGGTDADDAGAEAVFSAADYGGERCRVVVVARWAVPACDGEGVGSTRSGDESEAGMRVLGARTLIRPAQARWADLTESYWAALSPPVSPQRGWMR